MNQDFSSVPPDAGPQGASKSTGWGQDPELVQEFIAEALEHLATVEEDILAVERLGAEGSGEVIHHLFRSLHTVKGGANLLGFSGINQLAHALENLVGLIRSGEMAVDRPLVDVLLKGTDTLQRLVQHPDDVAINIQSDLEAAQAVLSRRGTPPDSPAGGSQPAIPAVNPDPNSAPFASPAGLGGRTEAAQDSQTGRGQTASAAAPPVPAAAEVKTKPSRRRRAAGAPAKPVSPVTAPPATDEPDVSRAPADEFTESAGDQTVRIPLVLLDRLMNLASELVLVRNQNVQATECRDLEQLAAVSLRLNVVTSELQATVMQTRMRPIGSVFTKFNRMVRDLARKLGKEIELEIIGSEVELDKTIVEAIGDPLTHLVRNAVDHGIETPPERRQSGKPPAGHVSLRAFHRDGQVFVQIQDDGKGLEPAALKRAAVDKGILRTEEADSLTDREALALIFRPGFSMAATVTDLSGRGVGMDVVKSVFQRLGGTVDLSSTAGQGTTVTVKLPLTLAIVPTLIVAVGEHYFAIPQINIDEVVWLHGTAGQQAVKRVADQEVYGLRGKLLPVLRLAKVLDLGGFADGGNLARSETAIASGPSPSSRPEDSLPTAAPPPDSAYIVVLKHGNERFGLVVDTLIDTKEIVVKPLHDQLKESRAFSGTTVLGDGRIALILDIAAVAEVGALRFTKTEAPVGPTKSSHYDKQTVLLFDLGSAERFFIPLCLITRVEEIRPDQVQVAGQREYLDFRGKLIPLVRIEQTIPGLAPQYLTDRLYVIVPKCPQPFGVLAARILDTVQVPQHIDTATVKLRGVVGSQMINGRMALFLDPFSAIETIEPDWLADEFSRVGGVPRVLIVDDSPFTQIVLCSYLHGAGVAPTLAANGREGLEALSRGGYDVVVSDLEMPVMDGFEFARAIRQQACYRELPLLAVSGAGEEMRSRSLDAGFDDFRSKFDRQGFLEVFTRLCQATRLRHGQEVSRE